MVTDELLSIDFGALRTLRLVWQLGSFSKAAAELGVKQSTVSYTIDRLRKALDDPLFVRQGGGIAATERCAAAVGAAEQILSEIEDLAAHSEFNPAAAEGTITISCNYYARMTFLGDVVRRIRSDAPGLDLHLVPGFIVGPLLFGGDVDIAISPIPAEASGLFRQVLTKDNPVCLMDKSNPLAKGPVTMEDYCTATHAYVDFGASVATVMERELKLKGLSINKAITIPDPAALPNLISGTDLIATIPSRFAGLFSDQLAIAGSPMTWQTHIYMFWTARSHRSPLNIWMRDLIAASAEKLEPPYEP